MRVDKAVNNSDRISTLRKVGYGLGEAGSQFSWSLISSYLTVFYTDVVGLTPAIISVIMLVARIWDAINDPMFGAIAENNHSKYGRYRPFILFGTPVLVIFNCLAFYELKASMVGKILWCCLTYIGCGMAYTVVNLSVGCIANSMTTKNRVRVSLNAYRGLMSGIAQIIVSAITMPMILSFGDSTSSGTGYFKTAVVFSLISIPCFLACFFSTKETVGNGRTQHRGNTTLALFRSFKYTFSDRNAVLLVMAMFAFLTGIFGRLGIMAYYFIYVLENPQLMAAFATAMSIGMFLVNLYAPFFLNHFEKKYVGAASAICQAICCMGFYFAGSLGLIKTVVVIGFFYGFTNLAGLVSFSLSAEIIDDNWIRTGIRSDGVIYSCISFSTKLGNAIGGSIGILALGAVGFVANTDLSRHTIKCMNQVINFGPAIFFLLAAVLFVLNGMTNAKGLENEKKLIEMKIVNK